jgi:hypothetical protein
VTKHLLGAGVIAIIAVVGVLLVLVLLVLLVLVLGLILVLSGVLSGVLVLLLTLLCTRPSRSLKLMGTHGVSECVRLVASSRGQPVSCALLCLVEYFGQPFPRLGLRVLADPALREARREEVMRQKYEQGCQAQQHGYWPAPRHDTALSVGPCSPAESLERARGARGSSTQLRALLYSRRDARESARRDGPCTYY